MGTVHSTLSARLDVVKMMDGLMQGADRDLVKIWQKMNAPRFDNIMLKTKTAGACALPEGIEVTFALAKEGGTAPAPQVYDLVLQAHGQVSGCGAGWRWIGRGVNGGVNLLKNGGGNWCRVEPVCQGHKAPL
jgi:pyruvate/2-oxoglutarate dehydrogenase complex dihydrolipoamide dehydrogenase (E3) component